MAGRHQVIFYNAMKRLKYFFLFIFCLSIGAASAWLSRLQLASFLTQYYLNKYDISLQMKLVELSTERILIQDIILDQKNVIPLLDISYSLFEKKLSSVKLNIRQLDLNSLQSLSKKIQTNSVSAASAPLSYSEGLKVCQKILEPALQVNIEKLLIDQKVITPKLAFQKQNDGLHLEWKDPQFEGELDVRCQENLISIDAPKVAFKMRAFHWEDLTVDHLEFEALRSFLHWSPTTSLQFALPGSLSLAAQKSKETLKIDTPFILISGQSANLDLNKVIVHGLLKNGRLEKDQIFSFASLEMNHTVDFKNPSVTSAGNFKFKNITVKTKKDFLTGLNVTSQYDWTGNDYALVMDLKDQTKELSISNLKISGSPASGEHVIHLDPQRSIIQFNSQITKWLPILKESVKTMSGSLQLQGRLSSKNQKLYGAIQFLGKKISAETEFGNFENLSFSHKINSFETLASPPHQQLEVERILIGPGIKKLKLSYQIHNLKNIKVDELSFSFEEAQITARNFNLNSSDKQVENFSAVILNLSLEKTLALALKETVSAQGRLQGHLDVDYMGTRPIIKGLLAAPTEGWIRYHTEKPQGQLSVSDGPMDILNNYLYNFHYNTLSLKISSDTDYNMHLLLGTLGHNPDYLDGKPLKLNINLQQNLLAALQSMMLTYDLPSKIKERLEKVDP